MTHEQKVHDILKTSLSMQKIHYTLASGISARNRYAECLAMNQTSLWQGDSSETATAGYISKICMSKMTQQVAIEL